MVFFSGRCLIVVYWRVFGYLLGYLVPVLIGFSFSEIAEWLFVGLVVGQFKVLVGRGELVGGVR